MWTDTAPARTHCEAGRRILHKELISGVVAHALASSVESLAVDRPLTESKNKMAEVTDWGGDVGESRESLQHTGCKFM